MLETTLTQDMDCLPKSRFQSLKKDLQIEATEYLDHIVSSLNKRLSEWYEEFGKTPDLRWRYGLYELKELALFNKDLCSESHTRASSFILTFNSRFKDWRDKMACSANFMWQTEEDSAPRLVITEIDMLIYRKPAPSKDAVKEAIERVVEQRVSAL